MSRPVIDRQSHRRLRASLLALAAVLGLLAVCLLVFGTTARQSQLGAIVGLWAALIAAFEAPAFRRTPPEIQPPVDLSPLATQLAQHHELQLQATKDSIAAQGVDLRRAGELQMARESAARREADVNLQLAIRHEVERTVQDQFGVLRQEVSSLRAEVVDKLGGQIKLERIETTRVIGSDLEALQNQIRRLAEDRERWDRAEPITVEPVTVEPVGAQPPAVGSPDSEPVLARPLPAVTAPITAPLLTDELVRTPPSYEQAVMPERPVPEQPMMPEPDQPVMPERPVPEQPAGETLAPSTRPASPAGDGWGAARSVRSAAADREATPSTGPQPAPASERRPASADEPPPSGQPVRRLDPFADLPRLTPVPPDVLEPIRAPEPSGRRRAPEDDPDSPHYVGRRRPGAGRSPDPVPLDETDPGLGRRRAPGHSSD